MTVSLNSEVATALYEFGLITEEQADSAITKWEREWEEAYENARWWNDLAEIAWKGSASWFSRFLNVGVAPAMWKLDWIRERRGF